MVPKKAVIIKYGELFRDEFRADNDVTAQTMQEVKTSSLCNFIFAKM